MKIQDAILSKYDTNLEGLSLNQVNERQAKFGPNELKEKKKKSKIQIFLMQFADILIILLILAAIASYFIGDIIDSLVILFVVVLNAVVGYRQEYKAEKAMNELKNLVNKKAVVRRKGQISKINAKDLTIGDIVLVEEGDKIPADLLLLETAELKIDESSLTGESDPVNKTAKYRDNVDLDVENNINENIRDNLVYMDSNVVSGRGVGLVYAIGMDTSIGKIASVIQEESPETPLQEKVDKLGKILGFIAIITCVFVFILESFEGMGLVENFMTAVALAVAAVPEGLPAVLTLTLALGMEEMAKSNGIIRRLLAVETLGSCNIICTDKTGTLTLNQMTVRESEIYSNKTYEGAYLCNNAVIKEGKLIGDSTDGAALQFAEESDYKTENLKERYPRIKEIPLTSDRKRMTTIHSINEDSRTNDILKQIKIIEDKEFDLNDKKLIAFTKGAPEIILATCKYIDNNGKIERITKKTRSRINKSTKDMTQSALRVLAIGYRIIDDKELIEDRNNLTENNVEKEFIFSGLIGIMDPPKKEAKEAIKKCKTAGIKVIMITGDHKDTAAAIASELEILTDGKILTGDELNKLSNEEYLAIADDIQVYARVYPEQKLRIVESLKSKGNVVSMTGDGVNDAPALKKASIGVAMGNGTDVAKESSDMILQDNNFATIVKAIEEGRKIFDNIKRFVKFQVSTNVGAILTIVGATIIDIPLPFNAIQILWINIIMDGPPAQSLGMEGAEKNIMERKPENGDILERKDYIRILISGIVMAVGTLGVFIYELNTNTRLGTKLCLEKSMTVAFTLFVVYQLFSAYCNRSDSEKKNRYFAFAMLLSLILQICVIYIGPLQKIFKTASIGIMDWILIFVVAATIFVAEFIMRKTLLKKSI
ncbi:cation-translocating P-type ATPase [Methanobrevibacter boviskoreani]|jgi:Ca2+-transporting ATPase|uniref:cation-translocating P-type ATPase n=1 Tax=Methanobrevibacter boviskoreani TaxID=1348249 RepID=UPI0005932975|nr:cation-translocating P-type ATPase [Methanobrevibacter boviskoreani]